MSRSYRRDYSKFVQPFPKCDRGASVEPHEVDIPGAGFNPPKRAKSHGSRAYEPGKKQGLRFHRQNAHYMKGRY